MINAPYIDPQTKDFILTNGQILNKDMNLSRINMALYCRLGTWKFHPDFGCDIYKFLGARGKIVNKRQLELSAQRALQFMIDDGTFSSVTALCTSLTLTTAIIKLFITEITQQQFVFVWTFTQTANPV